MWFYINITILQTKEFNGQWWIRQGNDSGMCFVLIPTRLFMNFFFTDNLPDPQNYDARIQPRSGSNTTTWSQFTTGNRTYIMLQNLNYYDAESFKIFVQKNATCSPISLPSPSSPSSPSTPSFPTRRSEAMKLCFHTTLIALLVSLYFGLQF